MIYYKTKVNPLIVDTFIKHERNKNGGVITPAIANKVLEMTNHYINLKVVLKEINKLDKEKRLEFSGFVLEAITARKHRNSVYEGLKKLAEEGDYLDKFHFFDSVVAKDYDDDGNHVFFAKQNRKPKGDLSDYDSLVCDENIRKLGSDDISSTDKLYLPNVCDFSLVDDLDLTDKIKEKDGRYKELKFKSGGKISLKLFKASPEKMEFDKAEVSFVNTDLRIVKELVLNECERVYFHCCELNENLDITSCKEVEFSYCYDLDKIKNLDFSRCKIAKFRECGKLPDGCDFSNCDSVRFSSIDLCNWDTFKFKDGCSVHFIDCDNIPNNFDLSPFAKVYFDTLKAYTLYETVIKFREGVSLRCERTTMPQKIDFSKCGEIKLCNMWHDSFAYTEEFKFRDKAQYEEVRKAIEKVKGFIGARVIFADEAKAHYPYLNAQKTL